MQPRFIDRPGYRLAYDKQEGDSPAILFLSGFRSDMTGTKAEALAHWCKQHHRAFVRFDYMGHGQSGGDFMDGSIGAWKDDTLCVIDELTEGEIILIGSSMGAWLGLLAALERPNRIKTFVGLASAPDFTEELIYQQLTPAQKSELMEKGVYYAPSCYGEDPYPITRHLIEEGRLHLLMGGPIPLSCPSVLLHGTADADVPLSHGQKLADLLPSARLITIENGDHRLSSRDQISLFLDVVSSIINAN